MSLSGIQMIWLTPQVRNAAATAGPSSMLAPSAKPGGVFIARRGPGANQERRKDESAGERGRSLRILFPCGFHSRA
jgi:hypothetical protein